MVEIIPKRGKKPLNWQNVLLYFSFFLLLLGILSYFLLDNSLKKAQATLRELEETLAREKTGEELTLEKEVLSYERKIKDFSKVIANHLFLSKFFEFIEKNTHPKIWFSALDLNSKARKAQLSAQTDNFLALAQQLQILKDNPLVENLNLTKITVDKEGKINFDLQLDFSPNLFEY